VRSRKPGNVQLPKRRRKWMQTRSSDRYLKGVALAMGIVSIVMGFIPNAANMDTHITLLGIGLVALGLASLMKEE